MVAISSGELPRSFDPEISEWSNPPLIAELPTEYIGWQEGTRRTETSKYAQEKKSKEIP